ncbi:unnamed protein product, partial [marine sediment metagenome]
PYYGSEPSQIQGLVSGFGVGAFYLNSNTQAGFSSMYWSSLNLALIVGGLPNPDKRGKAFMKSKILKTRANNAINLSD